VAEQGLSFEVRLASETPRGPSRDWIYLGEDYVRMRAWEDVLSKDRRIRVGERVDQAIRALRPSLVEWALELGRGQDHMWWMSPLGSRNPMQTRVFLDLCHLHILFDEVVPLVVSSLTVVCEDVPLTDTVARNLRTSGHRVWGTRTTLRRVRETMVASLAWGIRWMRAIRDTARSARAAKRSRDGSVKSGEVEQLRGRVLMRTCLDDGCLGPSGLLTDRYFGGLAEALRKRGYAVEVLPWLYNIRRPLEEAYRHVRHATDAFVPYDYLRLSDYALSCVCLMRAGRGFRRNGQFAGREIGPLLVREGRAASACGPGNLSFALCGAAIRRRVLNGAGWDTFIDMFENMAVERPTLHALRTCAPDTVTIGYQHAMLPLELMGYSYSGHETENQLVPDVVVSNGHFGYELLLERGFPKGRVRAGPSLRYRDVLSAELRTSRPNPGHVLILLPLDLPAAVELAETVMDGCESFRAAGARVLVKSHPMMDRNRVLRTCGRSELPAGWQWASGPIGRVLENSLVAVGTGTGALVEAAAAAVAVVSVAREIGFSYNPLEPWIAVSPQCATVERERVTQRTLELLAGGSEAESRSLAAAIRASFSPLNDETVRAFTGEAG
jgi:hypothetical protein